ncbi:hypothetical protein AK812_SmicGene20382 [Symbiodinium microadriaticum]|uniref:Uncharacterized protein n=1 Tax=Symbiodinium microadriaticum TaxID=2951 RepID=A0A1Q9DQ55_SYMMI|nr:hypothetical protein AK812_SmicGene20382 [Symbiodinium microadriaticum]
MIFSTAQTQQQQQRTQELQQQEEQLRLPAVAVAVLGKRVLSNFAYGFLPCAWFVVLVVHFVLYHETVVTDRCYMRNATAIPSEMLIEVSPQFYHPDKCKLHEQARKILRRVRQTPKSPRLKPKRIRMVTTVPFLYY